MFPFFFGFFFPDGYFSAIKGGIQVLGCNHINEHDVCQVSV
jgi:hypothetical protein